MVPVLKMNGKKLTLKKLICCRLSSNQSPLQIETDDPHQKTLEFNGSCRLWWITELYSSGVHSRATPSYSDLTVTAPAGVPVQTPGQKTGMNDASLF